MRILVVGAGVYVLGRGTSGLGTVLPTLAQASKQIDIDEVTICSTSDRGRPDVARATAEINRRLGSSLKVSHALLEQALPARLSSQAFPAAPAFDCAIISVPDHLHFEIGRRALEAGLHCLMVKPFVPTMEEGRRLISLAEERHLYGAVEFHKRFDEANLIVRRMVNEGRVGTLAYATVEYSQRITVPRDLFAGWAARTNIFQYLGVHYVDLLHFITGYQPRRLTAVGHRGVLTGLGIDTYDSVHVMLEWEQGFVSQFAVGWIDPERSSAISDQRYLLVGSDGRIECDQKNRGLRVVGPGGPGGPGDIEDINPYFSEYLARPGEPLEFGGYGYQSILRFLLDVKSGVDPSSLEGKRPTFRSALASTAVLQAVRESLEAGSGWKTIDAAA
jgi:predicted dehydrogenase